jgi:DNA-binding NarL/FixJ family response regulator
MIVILTTYDLPEYREAAVRFRADYFFSKDSITNEEVIQLVKSILSKKGFRGIIVVIGFIPPVFYLKGRPPLVCDFFYMVRTAKKK